MKREHNVQYKLLASDLDGTLFDPNKQISEQNMEAIKRLVERGIPFVPVTGRSLCEMPNVVAIPQIRYYIYSNGTAIWDKKCDQKTVFGLSKEQANFVLDTFYSYQVHMTVRHNGQCYEDETCHTEEHCAYHHVNMYHFGVMEEYAVFTDQFKELVYSMDQIEVITGFFHSREEMKECRDKLEKTGLFQFAESYDYNLEVFHKEAGKGKALMRLAKMLGIQREETIMAGDSGNDITCVEAAGLGLAVENACEELKKVADQMICSNAEHIVAYIEERFF